MIYPGAFNLTTGPLHWERKLLQNTHIKLAYKKTYKYYCNIIVLQRARAVDNQVI